MSDSDVVDVKTVVQGGHFCTCGGLMNSDGSHLMSSPVKTTIVCPLCGQSTFVQLPYNPKIALKRGN